MALRKMGIILSVLIVSMGMFGCEKDEVEALIPKEHIGFDESKLDGLSKQTIEDVSYNSSIEPNELTLEESINYVMKHTSTNLIEVNREFIEEFGITEVIYDASGKMYHVRYMHPEIEINEEISEEEKKDDTKKNNKNTASTNNTTSSKKGEDALKYDLQKTNGIWIYEYI